MATTFSPTDKNAAITLSNANLTATGNSGTNGGVRGTSSNNSGKVQLQYTNVTLNDGLDYVGVGTAADTLGLASGSQIQVILISPGTSFSGDGAGGTNSFPDGIAPGTNGTVDLCIDFTALLFWFRINGGNWNGSGTANPVTGTGGHAVKATGTMFPYVRLTNTLSHATINPSPTPVSGFIAWDAPPTGVTGTWTSTEAKDTFAAAGFQPVSGTAVTSENQDKWSTTSGFQVLGIESIADNYASGSTLFNTLGPDRIIVLMYVGVSVVTTPGNITGITDTSGLTWFPELEQIAGPSSNSDNTIQQIWWAYAHNKLTNDIITISGAGASSVNVTVFAVKGLNGNYDYPWDKINAHAFGGTIGSFSGGTSNPQLSVPVSTGLGVGLKYPSMLISNLISIQGVSFDAVPPPVGFTSIAQTNTGGSQRVIAEQTAFQQELVDIKSSDNVLLSNLTAAHEWAFFYDTLVCGSTNPGFLQSTEAADHMDLIGHPGSGGIIGDLGSFEAPDHMVVFGFERDSGIFVTTENTDIFSAFIKLPITGHFIVTEATDRFSAAGVGRGENGVFITTEAVDKLTMFGIVPISGTFNVTEAPDRFSAIGVGVTQVRRRRQTFVT